MDIGHRIRLRRQALGLTQQEIADLAGFAGGGTTVRHWEAGRRYPSTAQVLTLARILGRSPGWLLAGGLPDHAYSGGDDPRRPREPQEAAEQD